MTDSTIQSQRSPKEASSRPKTPLLLSQEFRKLYLAVVTLMILMSGGLLWLFLDLFGGEFYHAVSPARFLAETAWYWLGSLVFMLVAIGVIQARRYYLRNHESALEEFTNAELEKLKEGDFEQFDRIKRIREEKARVDFERNAADFFLVKSLELNGVDFFGPSTWRLRPGVNILLGRNGFGKSLILRSLAALLQRNEEASRDLFNSSTDGYLQLEVERNGDLEMIRREAERFTESAGKIPILAIPDSRFVNRGETLIEAPTVKHIDDGLDLRSDGARHFLEDMPYGEMVRMLLNELCFDYLESKSFDKPVFALLQRTIQELTGDRFRFHSVERVGRNAFRLLVLTEGNDRPLPIQYASQGNLSVLGVVGIIRSYLSALFPNVRSDELLKKPAIVLIDELDAHLHPLWQQKLIGILRTSFPNVQFVLTAHSPLVVAGCWVGEVTVMRRSERGLIIEQLERDFLGTSVEEIYKVIFGVEDFDESYLQSASRASTGFSHQKRISELESKREPTELERRELPRLIREEAMIVRAGEVAVERQNDQQLIVELEAKIESLEDQLNERRV
jgi:predicted ATPase